MRVMTSLSVLALNSVIISACATQPKPQPVPVVTVQCLPLASYSPEEQRKAAAELAALPQGSSLAKLVIDYGKLRAADRACLETPPH